MLPSRRVKARAFLFGLNYKTNLSKNLPPLQGCINDVNDMATFLKTKVGIAACEVITDEDPKTRRDTTFSGMINKLYSISTTTWRENLDYVWIHFSGHGTFTPSMTEEDGRDECLVPCDAAIVGNVIKDDTVSAVFRSFNPRTRVVAVFDCCNSGTMGDLPMSWLSPNAQKREATSDMWTARASQLPRIITFSACLDSQVAADALIDGNRFGGALTTSLLQVLERLRSQSQNVNVFDTLDMLRVQLTQNGFGPSDQQPVLCSSYNILREPMLFP